MFPINYAQTDQRFLTSHSTSMHFHALSEFKKKQIHFCIKTEYRT